MGTIDEAASADRNGAATPCADAIAPLATLVNSDKKPYPDYVRLAGLIGLVRHAELGIKDDKTRGNVKSLFVKILDPQFAVQKGLRDDVYEWFQEKAVQGLAAFKTPDGANGGTGTLDLFKQLINDDKQKYEVRCLAARAIGEMDLTAAAGYDFLDLSKSLVLLARGFCTENMSYIDTEIVRDSVKSSAASGVSTGSGAMGGGMGMGSGMGMGGGMSGGAMGGGMTGSGNIQNAKSLEAIAARILYGFDSVERAVKGVKNGGQGVMAQLDDSKEPEKEMKENLDTMIQEFAEMAEFVKNGADVIVNMTNDRWSGSADAAFQHATIAVFRSVETRKTMVRSTNSGQTCMILPTGELIDPVEQFKMTYHIYDVPVYESATYGHTFYVEHTDILAYSSIAASAAALVIGALLMIMRRRKEK